MLRLILATALLAGTSFSAMAQDAPPPPAAKTPAPATAGETSTDSKSVTNPNLTVASVKLDSGYRASKVIGGAVYNDQNQQIGSVDDLVLNAQNQVVLAVVSVGGFLGVGGKLVAMPYDNLKRDGGKITIPGADKNSLAAMPSFTWGP